MGGLRRQRLQWLDDLCGLADLCPGRWKWRGEKLDRSCGLASKHRVQGADPYHQKATITEGPNFYQATTPGLAPSVICYLIHELCTNATPAVYSETSATMHESCAINAAESSALCVVTVVAANYNTGDAISKTISYNLTGTGYYQYDVKITAGASHTANGGSCVAKSNTANSSISARGSREVLLTAFVILAGVGGVLWM